MLNITNAARMVLCFVTPPAVFYLKNSRRDMTSCVTGYGKSEKNLIFYEGQNIPENKKQLIRMIRIVADLRKNSYPNCTTLVKKLRDADLYENINICCSQRTIKRDIDVLKKDFGAPIEFDYNQNGYYLTDRKWMFECPALCDDLISSSLLGARLAEDIMPQPIKNKISRAVDSQLTTNNSELLDNTFIESMMIASGIKAVIKPETFKTVFDGWRHRRAIEFVYHTPNGQPRTRIFEPHLISFLKGLWYVKGVEKPEGKTVVFAIHRMDAVKLTDELFKINRQILQDTRKNGLFVYEKHSGIKLHCDASIAFYFYEHQEARELEITRQDNGSLIVVLPPSIEHDALRWILGEAGKIRVMEPEWLREKVVAAAKKIVEVNS